LKAAIRRRLETVQTHTLVAAAFLALAIVMTWPLARLAHPELPDWEDSQFNVWRLAWVAHQLKVDPRHLFDTNVFYPATNTLAYSDAMLFLGVCAAPLIWIGIHPFVVHNLAVIVSFWLAGYFAYRLCFRLTGALTPSVAGGVIFGFAPYRFGHIAHLELLWTVFMPLGLLALIDLVSQPAPKAAVRLAIYFALQTLCSVYYGVFFAMFLTMAAVVLLIGKTRQELLQTAKWLVAAGALAGVLILPYLAQYSEARRSIAARPVDEITRYSARPADYLRVARDNKVLTSDRAEGEEERALFPGFIAVALVGIAAARSGRPAVRFLVLIAVAVELSFGMRGIVYPWLVHLMPMLTGLRAPARFAAIVLLNVSVLAAIGLARLQASSRVARWVPPLLVAVMLFEYWAVPLKTRTRPKTPPPAYAWLARQPKGVVLELPVPKADELWGFETEYQLMSIYHWFPLVNGYSGSAPTSYLSLVRILEEFPSDGSVARLRQVGVRWVLIHEELLGSQKFSDLLLRVTATGAFRVQSTFPDGMGKAVVLELLPTGS